MLFLISTPIGNLSDITLRALTTLKEADLILCEDTRTSLTLLHHYEIKKPLESYHKFNESKKIEPLIEKLENGLKICLISDAGTPLISDPGLPIVQACIEHGIAVIPIPGPCSIIHALIASGFQWDQFQFVGFLPKKPQELRKSLMSMINYPGVSIAFETPHRLIKTLEYIHELRPSASICVARELTKKYESYVRGNPKTIIDHFATHPLKGECILMIQGEEEIANFDEISLSDHVGLIQKQYNTSKKEAIKVVAELRSLNKRELYNILLEKP